MGTRTAATNKNRQGQEQSRQASPLPAVTLGQSQTSGGERHAIPTHEPCRTATSQSPQMSQSLLNLKTNCFGVTRSRTWPGEGISLLVKKIRLYANSIFTEEDTPGNARVRERLHPSWSTQAPLPSLLSGLVTDMKIKRILVN